MNSKIIDNAMLDAIDDQYPVAGRNNTTQGFRDNYRAIKSTIMEAAVELSRLRNQTISIEGDATGISGIFDVGTNPTSPTAPVPTPINLVLADTGVAAGTYSSVHQTLELTVDSKGRVTLIEATPLVPNPILDDEFQITSTVNPLGNTTQLRTPRFTFDEYGTLIGVVPDADEFDFGIYGHPLQRGELLVGNNTNVSVAFPPPAISFNPADIWALAWRPSGSNPTSLEWFKLPAIPPASTALVETILAGPGISVSADPTDPEIAFELDLLPDYPANTAIQPGTQVAIFDPATNQTYKADLSLAMGSPVVTGFLQAVEDDPNPKLGGNLEVLHHKIIGNSANGIQLETNESSRLILRNITQPLIPSDPVIVREQRFPTYPPSFDQTTEIDVGITSAHMMIDTAGNMYWDKTQFVTDPGVTSITSGAGIGFNIVGPITDTGTISVDFSSLPIRRPNVFNDFLAAQNDIQEMYRGRISDFTMTFPTTVMVDPESGIDDSAPTRGQPNMPFRTIQAAINRIPASQVQTHTVVLFPGIYNENFVIERPNIRVMGLMGPDVTTVRGGVEIADTTSAISLSGINFTMLNVEVNAPPRALTIGNGVGSLHVSDCYFFRETDEDDRLLELIRMEGENQGPVLFDNCMFNGRVYNYLNYDTSNPYDDGYVVFRNISGNEHNMMTLHTGPLTLTRVMDVDVMCQVHHDGGMLELKNIGSLYGDFADSVWASMNPGEEPGDLGYTHDGLTSSAPLDLTNILMVTNVSLSYTSDFVNHLMAKIVKTGTCYWEFNNVDHFPLLDTIVGERYRYAGATATDIPETVITETVTGTYTASVSRSRTWDLTLDDDTTITLSEDNYALNIIYPNAYANSMTIVVRNTGAFTATFAASGGIIWSESPTQPANAMGANMLSVYTFLRIGNTWMGSRSFNQV